MSTEGSMGNNIKKLKKDEINKYYEIQQRLGTGSFATVKEAIRKSDGKHVAIKIIKKSKLNPEELAVVHDEVEIMRKVDHPSCVQMLDIYETSKKLYIVMELLVGGELFDRIVAKGSFSEKEAAELIRDMTSAIKALHAKGIVHRDLKPENLLYESHDENARIKITDFGLAKFRPATENTMTTACGTPGYVAPEVLKGEPYGPEVDLWSIGVILYILLCGFPPFYHDSTPQLYKQIKRGEFDFPAPYWTDITPEAKDLVSRLLTVNPKRRITADGVLEHPWIVSKASSAKITNIAPRIRLLVARRQLRQGIAVLLAAQRFRDLFAPKNKRLESQYVKPKGKAKGK